MLSPRARGVEAFARKSYTQTRCVHSDAILLACILIHFAILFSFFFIFILFALLLCVCVCVFDALFTPARAAVLYIAASNYKYWLLYIRIYRLVKSILSRTQSFYNARIILHDIYILNFFLSNTI